MNWAEHEFETVDLGDMRFNRRVINIAQTLGLAHGRTIPQAFQSWSAIKASYNFFSNGSVSDEKILAPHIKQTIDRMGEYPVLLLLDDTTELDYSSKDAVEGKER